MLTNSPDMNVCGSHSTLLNHLPASRLAPVSPPFILFHFRCFKGLSTVYLLSPSIINIDSPNILLHKTHSSGLEPSIMMPSELARMDSKIIPGSPSHQSMASNNHTWK